ncbi:MAG: sterol desaturase family protein, partial [Myxococcota bacterium]|nr:sterol desaturase family protein [Myxococcota bacterium]
MDSTLFAALSFLIPAAFVALELISNEYRDMFRDRERLSRNGAYLITAAVVINIVKELNLWLVPLLPRMPAAELPWWLDLMGCILFAELVNYTLHFVKHKSQFLWKFHFQHHIESKFNMWLITHTHGLEVIISGTL